MAKWSNDTAVIIFEKNNSINLSSEPGFNWKKVLIPKINGELYFFFYDAV